MGLPDVRGGIGAGDPVHGQRRAGREHHVLGVPAVELEARAFGGAVPRQPVVVPGPVPVPAPEVHDHVVHVVGQIQQTRIGGIHGAVGVLALELLEGLIGLAGFLALRQHQVQCRSVALGEGEALVFEHIPVFFLAAVVAAGEGPVRPLARDCRVPSTGR